MGAEQNSSETQARAEQPAGLPDYETKAQVARRLGVSERTIENMMRARRIPFIKLTSKIVRFPRREVDDYLRRNLTVKAHGQNNEDNL